MGRCDAEGYLVVLRRAGSERRERAAVSQPRVPHSRPDPLPCQAIQHEPVDGAKRLSLAKRWVHYRHVRVCNRSERPKFAPLGQVDLFRLFGHLTRPPVRRAGLMGVL